MGLRDKTTPTMTTPLIRANMSSVVATIFSSLAFLSLSISMAKLSRLVAASFSSLALLSSSVSTANLRCLLATTFSSLRYLSNSFSSPHFQSFESAQAQFLVVVCFLINASYPLPFVPLSAVAGALFALSFPFISEHFVFVHAKSVLAHRVEMNNMGDTGQF